MPATRIWVRHFGNSLYLKFISSNPLATPAERQQANRELPIADQKMAYWAKHKNFDLQEATRETEQLRKQWSQR
jgi:hypothetical protein